MISGMELRWTKVNNPEEEEEQTTPSLGLATLERCTQEDI